MAGCLGQFLPRHVEREGERLGEAVHNTPIPGVGIVLESLAHEAAAEYAALGVGHEELRMRDLVDPEAAAGAAGAFRIVEHEKLGLDAAVDEVVRCAAKSLVEALGLSLVSAFEYLHLHQAVADQEGRGDACLDGFFVFRGDHEAVDHGIHVADLGLVEIHLVRKIHAASVDHQLPAALLANLGEDDLQFLAVNREDGGAQFDLRAFGQRQDGFQSLVRGAAGDALAGARAMRFGDGGEQQVEVARDVGHGADCGARIAADGLLLDRNHGRKTEDEIHIRLGHLRYEALGEGGERLHVAPLALGVDGVEGEAGFAGARKSGDYDQAVARQREGDVLQVMNARALHGNRGAGGFGFTSHRRLPRRRRRRVPLHRCCCSW